MNLQKMFMLLCGCICIATFAVIVVIVNTDTEKAIIQEYQQKADILLRSMKAVRAYTGGVVRPAEGAAEEMAGQTHTLKSLLESL